MFSSLLIVTGINIPISEVRDALGHLSAINDKPERYHSRVREVAEAAIDYLSLKDAYRCALCVS